jgi:hypothetical protein
VDQAQVFHHDGDATANTVVRGGHFLSAFL